MNEVTNRPEVTAEVQSEGFWLLLSDSVNTRSRAPPPPTPQSDKMDDIMGASEII